MPSPWWPTATGRRSRRSSRCDISGPPRPPTGSTASRCSPFRARHGQGRGRRQRATDLTGRRPPRWQTLGGGGSQLPGTLSGPRLHGAHERHRRRGDGACNCGRAPRTRWASSYAVAEALGLDADRVRCTTPHGRRFRPPLQPRLRHSGGAAVAAAGVPVKLIWSREEDIRQDHYRPAVASRFKAGLDAAAVLWPGKTSSSTSTSPPRRPTCPTPSSTSSCTTPTARPTCRSGRGAASIIPSTASSPSRSSTRWPTPPAAIPSSTAAICSTTCRATGPCWNCSGQRSDWYRPLAAGQRPRHRAAGVVRQHRRPGGGRHRDRGPVCVDRVVCVADPGLRRLAGRRPAQMESGIVYGLTAALYGEIGIENGAVVQSNFHDYPDAAHRRDPADRHPHRRVGRTLGRRRRTRHPRHRAGADQRHLRCHRGADSDVADLALRVRERT
jgi:hypothetical protein